MSDLDKLTNDLEALRAKIISLQQTLMDLIAVSIRLERQMEEMKKIMEDME